MYHRPVVFLQTNGLHVNPGIADHLCREAIALAHSREYARKLSLVNENGIPVGDGWLKTVYREVTLETVGGTEFHADISIGTRSFKVHFIVDLERLDESIPLHWFASIRLRVKTPAFALN